MTSAAWRTAEELEAARPSVWPEVARELSSEVDAGRAQVALADADQGLAALEASQLTLGSTYGSVLRNIAWLAVGGDLAVVLGAGDDHVISSLAATKALEALIGGQGLRVIAYDRIGGIFALDYRPDTPYANEVLYFGPETLKWKPLRVGYTQFWQWVLQQKFHEFYSHVERKGLRAALPRDLSFGVQSSPPIWTGDTFERARSVEWSAAPIEELWSDLHGRVRRQRMN